MLMWQELETEDKFKSVYAYNGSNQKEDAHDQD